MAQLTWLMKQSLLTESTRTNGWFLINPRETTYCTLNQGQQRINTHTQSE